MAMHSVRISDKAYRAYGRAAKRLGLTIEEFIDRSSPSDDGFVLTPEMRDAIERSLAQIGRGEGRSINVVREDLAQYQAEWRKGRKRSR